MSQSEILLPKMGESVAEATIIKWLKNEGDFVKADEAIVEIATDKVDSEVPSTAEGVLIKRLCNEGDVVQVGKPIALIGAEGSKPATNTAPVKESSVVSNEKPALTAPLKIASSNGKTQNSSSKFYSPLVKNIAKTEGLSVAELDTIAGTGLQGRVTKKDILN
ncbi:MAG TPA: biotin/lipoyl-containing protein, partial [Flavobacteriales bacterium]|nr:biotin/lipoyl-containing protein [Flavobacteriales bacterium]